MSFATRCASPCSGASRELHCETCSHYPVNTIHIEAARWLIPVCGPRGLNKK